MQPYAKDFYEITRGSSGSASMIVALLMRNCEVTSVLDVGCAGGTWLSAWKQAGVPRVLGIDGMDAEDNTLEIAPTEFMPHDLTSMLRLDARFDLAQSLEVAEHLPASAADMIVDALVSHSDIVLFSAAPPGQGGDRHVNEQPYAYWQAKFASRGFDLFDCIRPALRDCRDVRYWYRYNTFLFANSKGAARLSRNWQDTLLAAGQTPQDISPALFKLRKCFVRLMPVSIQTAISIRMARLRTGS
ncbi:MAG: class I SAM-dependent methyltransferase [Rhodobacteraceae bacterium]|nr:class I SAM-dependent methyltransferase [Paracoccaceae bacterium]